MSLWIYSSYASITIYSLATAYLYALDFYMLSISMSLWIYSSYASITIYSLATAYLYALDFYMLSISMSLWIYSSYASITIYSLVTAYLYAHSHASITVTIYSLGERAAAVTQHLGPTRGTATTQTFQRRRSLHERSHARSKARAHAPSRETISQRAPPAPILRFNALGPCGEGGGWLGEGGQHVTVFPCQRHAVKGPRVLCPPSPGRALGREWGPGMVAWGGGSRFCSGDRLGICERGESARLVSRDWYVPGVTAKFGRWSGRGARHGSPFAGFVPPSGHVLRPGIGRTSSDTVCPHARLALPTCVVCGE